MTPTTDLSAATLAGADQPAKEANLALVFRQKEALLADYLAAFAVVYYRQPAERAPAQVQATLHIETADTVFPPATVTLQLADTFTLGEVAAEAASRLPMVLAGVAEELGAAITRCRLSFPAPEAQTPEQTWCVTVAFGTGLDEAPTLGFSCPGSPTAPRETVYLPAHVQAVFAQLSSNPAEPVGYVFFLAEEEVTQLRQFQTVPPQVPEGGPQQLHQLFEQTARAYPNQVALSWLGQHCTYHELNEQADQLAARLQQQGVRVGDFVGLFMAKSVELYVGMLAVLKAGAAYVPLDLSFPADRVTYILGDCGARALLTHHALPAGFDTWPGLVIDLSLPALALPPRVVPAAVGPDSIAYVIYTSGTTGLPKGVLIPHRSICHLVRAEQVLFQPTPQDRVVQGFSVAFDASLEELWLAWGAGGTLVPVPEETMKAPDALPSFLVENQVTIFSTVPTLLSLLPAGIPTLRLLILGGEVCPPELLTKWASRQCRVVNTYGPTEATVVATAADFVPGQRLTIGRPLAGYEVLLLDQLGQLVPLGAAGELCIGGAALAAGYLNRPELSAAKFNTVSELQNGFAGRLYRTGDLARFEIDGNIDFLGRIDTQVKIRGFRVELAEIESLLLQWPGIRNAAVALKEGADGVKKLIAYLILDPNQLLDEKAVRAYLRERLAPYMLPAALVPLTAFPLLTSGKVDRKALPYPVGGAQAPTRELALPRTPLESAIYVAWQKRFDTADLSITDDFFEIGGNSLLASLIISEMRQLPDFQGLSVKEMYTRRTIEALAAAVAAQAAGSSTPPTDAPAAPPLLRASYATRVATAALQLVSIAVFYAVPVLLLNLSLLYRQAIAGWSYPALLAAGAASVLLYVPLACLVVVLMKWLVIGRFQAGEYPLWGFYYFRFWVVKKLVEAAPTQLLSATPFLAVFYRLLGAKIGKNVYLGSTRLLCFDLLTIGDGASVAREAALLGYRVEHDRLIIGPITVGQNGYVGLRAIMEGDTSLGEAAELDDLSVLPAGQQVPAREGWLGSPAQRTRAVAPTPPRATRPAGAGYLVAQALALALMLLVPSGASLPILAIIYEMGERVGAEASLLAMLPLAALYVLLLMGALALTKRLVAGRQADGTLPLHSLAYVRHWVADAVLAQSLALLKSLYATIYTPYWLRLLGAKIGYRAEVSTLNHISADHLTVGAGAFLADSVSVGAPRVQHGVVSITPTVVGPRTFIGNGAVLAGGTVLGMNNLIGALSSAPLVTPPDGTSWVGSPAFLLPNRPVSTSFAPELTFAPPTHLVWARAIIEIFKIILPFTFTFITFAVLYHYCWRHLQYYPFWSSVGVGTGVLVGLIFGFSLLTALLKWVLIGRYKPSEKPLWSSFVWRNELVNSLCESYVYTYWEAPLLGTPFATWFFQLMGSHFGHSVYMDTTEITEFDLAWVADHAVLNNGATIQTHLFEDRVMKMSTLRIGRYATVGTSSVVLYDSVIGPGATLKSLSLLMKGEQLPANTRWQGIPSAFISAG
ncbi:amino acid adenylation domain-containing protein [Hymenobacter sp. HMF4947]|uniref:Amino acid adenylation domain-containing protein n=1 Tax=Hymenobacter ginkgonis TaxID=2682976 RepID=A0A7K1T9L0_9BACT|nr:Pls/PosA family non-ribosomal peptide synthetase [Hymenobacter ginkgonis]MVN75097.1 amino acid adenylation domain-containing protein [Hymenobacter ginkgonis]